MWQLGWEGSLKKKEYIFVPDGSDSKESTCNAGDPGSIPESRRFPGEGHGNPLQYSCLENSMDRGAWQTTVHGVAKSQTWLSNWHFHIIWTAELLCCPPETITTLLLLFFSFIFVSWRLITLKYCSGFCHTLTWTSHGFTCIPHPDPPSHLPLYPIPLGLPSAPGPSTCLMHPTWWSVSPQIKYMFRCCSLETSHPRLLPQSPKVCSVHLCLFFCFAYRVIITIFLNSIYMC